MDLYFDLKNGYWQVDIQTDDREMPACTSAQRSWQFKVMSFALCNALTLFKRLIENVIL